MIICVASEKHTYFATEIAGLIEDAAQKRGTGIAKRSPEYIASKMLKGDAVIALKDKQVAGFCYIETWSHSKFVVNSGLIVAEAFRGEGLAKKIKQSIFDLSRKKYPEAKIFGITTSLAVMKINSQLGYQPVTFSELTTDDTFWNGCQSCVNYDILTRTDRKHCLCTGMLYTPKAGQPENKGQNKMSKSERWERFKNFVRKYTPNKTQNTNNLKIPT